MRDKRFSRHGNKKNKKITFLQFFLAKLSGNGISCVSPRAAVINQLIKVMKSKYLKIVITSANKVQYFAGDGIWFARISKAKFEEKLANGCSIWETVSHLPENVIRFA